MDPHEGHQTHHPPYDDLFPYIPELVQLGRSTILIYRPFIIDSSVV